jgi:hypothetical protein
MREWRIIYQLIPHVDTSILGTGVYTVTPFAVAASDQVASETKWENGEKNPDGNQSSVAQSRNLCRAEAKASSTAHVRGSLPQRSFLQSNNECIQMMRCPVESQTQWLCHADAWHV